MMRNPILTAAALTALTLGPALAQSYELDITAQLRDQGYQNITLSHTWLGRTRIVAILGSDLREIVIDPNTGEILRDLSRTLMAEGGSDTEGGATSGAAAIAGTGVAVAAGGGTAASTVRITAGVAALTAMDGTGPAAATIGIAAPLVRGPNGPVGQTPGGTPVDPGQTTLPFQILVPMGGQ